MAYLGTEGLAESQDMVKGSHWQDGPENTRDQVKQWPILRNYIHTIPEEEKQAIIKGVHANLKALRGGAVHLEERVQAVRDCQLRHGQGGDEECAEVVRLQVSSSYCRGL